MEGWLAEVRRLAGDVLPDVVVTGGWRRGRGGGGEVGSFCARHGGGVWTVHGPDGLRLASDDVGDVVFDEDGPSIRAAGTGWRVQRIGVLLRPGNQFPGLESAVVLEGPVRARVAGRPATGYVIEYPAGAGRLLTLWLDREWPLVLRARTGSALGAARAGSAPVMSAEIERVGALAAADRAVIDEHRLLLVRVRERRAARARGVVVDEGRARELARHVVEAFGPGARLEEVLEFSADQEFLFRVDVDGEPVYVARHRLDRAHEAILGRLLAFGMDSWAFTFDDRGVLGGRRLDDAAGALVDRPELTDR